MSIINYITCGKIIVFNSLLFKNRMAFAVFYNRDEEIVYRGIFGLKAISKKSFLSFAKIVDVFDYYDRSLTDSDFVKIKEAYREFKVIKPCNNVKDMINYIYSEDSGINEYKSE